jgi:hypothetical protein
MIRRDDAAARFAVQLALGLFAALVIGVGVNALYRLDRQATLCPAFTQPPDAPHAAKERHK